MKTTDRYGMVNGVLTPMGMAKRVSRPSDGGGGGGGVVSGSYDLRINPDFNPASPTLKNGVRLSGEALSAYEGAAWFLAAPDTRSYFNYGGTYAPSDDTYQYARHMANQYGTLLMGLRISGDARFLDEILRLSDIQYTKLAVGWRGHDTTKVVNGGALSSQHGYKMWVQKSGDDAYYWGTDYGVANAPRSILPIVQITRAFEANRGVDPKYATAADKWKAWLWDEWRHIWSGSFTATYVTDHSEYWGVRNIPSGYWPHLSIKGSRGRPDLGQYPFFHRVHLHTNIGCAMLHWEWGQLFDEQAAIDVAMQQFGFFFDLNVLTVSNSKYDGPSYTWPRTLQFLTTTDNRYHHPTTYAEYVFKDMMELWLAGDFPKDLENDFFLPAWRQINNRVLNKATPSSRSSLVASGDLGGNQSATGINSQGTSLTLTNSGWSEERADNFMRMGLHLSLAFDTSDDHGENKLREIWAVCPYGPINEPADLRYPLGVIGKGGNIRALPETAPVGDGVYSLVGSNTPPALPPNAQIWYDRATLPQASDTYKIIAKLDSPLGDCNNNTDPMYHIARLGGNEIVRMAIGLAVSKKLEFLDAIYEIMDVTYDRYRIYDSSIDTYRIRSAAECMQILDVALYIGSYALGTLILKKNEGLTSPKGYDYAAMYNRWAPFIRSDAERWWQSGGDWQGLQDPWGESSRRAARKGEYPYVLRTYGHVATRTQLYAYCLHELFGDSDSRYAPDYEKHRKELIEAPNHNNDTTIEGFVWGWGIDGHKRSYDATPINYSDYYVDMSVLMAMIGGSGWTVDLCKRIAKTFDNYVFDESTASYVDNPSNSTVAKSIVGDNDRTIQTPDGSVTYTVYQSRDRRNYKYVAHNSFPFLCVYDTGTRLRDIFTAFYDATGPGQSTIPTAMMAYHIINGT